MSRVYMIAEAGVNHNGDFNIAKDMVLVAKNAGADAIKFQTFVTENLVTRDAQTAEYQKQNTGKQETQFEMLKKLELSYDNYQELKELCSKTGIEFLSTPFDMDSIKMLEKLDIDKFKIPSGEITNYPYLVEIARTGKPIIMSSGMCTWDELEEAVRVLREHGAKDISLLHCTTEYPAPYNEVNLRVINAMRERFGGKIGYSDHTQGIEIAIAAAAMGAEIIEKHFTLSRDMEGPDHKASLEPKELKYMVQAIRNVEKALGSLEKKPSESERKNIQVARKSIVAKRNIEAGEIFSEENLTTKRPGTGLSPMLWNSILGQTAMRNFEKDECIEL